ncbi:MAG: primosomal protein N' [Micavibrio sp.]
MSIKTVLVPYPVERAYDYAVPDGLDGVLHDGDYVVVPLGSRNVAGVVWGQGGAEKLAPSKIKPIQSRYDVPPMPEAQRKFLDWAAHYTMTPPGLFLKLAMSVPAALEPPKDIKAYRLKRRAGGEGGDSGAQGENYNGHGGQRGQGLSPAARRVIDVAADGLARRPSELAREAGCSAAVIKTLTEKGWLEETILAEPPPCRNPDPRRSGPSLSEAQQKAASYLSGAVAAEAYKAVLLDGVTGSGKTEVYFEAVAQALKQGRQALILLPEIALSNAFLSRFKERFGCAPALWHSSLSDHRRKITWRGVATGESRVVVGARSALFLPYRDLGLIIVDEEHDPAYKQEEGVIYNARDMAVIRAHRGGIPVALISATPSLETMQNVWLGKYAHLELPDRHGGAGMPDTHIIDMRKDRPERGHFIAPPLREAMTRTLAGQGQVLLFLNRRGYAPLTLCRACGHRFECPRCTAWLIEHKKTKKLHCHHCGFDTKIPPACPKCGEADSLTPCGPGVERIFEEAHEAFPEARVAILSSDTADTHDKLKAVLDDIREHRIDIIIGTQIIAKGHHFPKLTCVGVIDADLGLSGGDLRASERTFQLLHQVAGRAGREAEKGHVYLQTFMPENRVMQALGAGGRDEFLTVEADSREAANMPPFSRLAGIIVSGRDEKQVMEAAKFLGMSAPHGQGLQTLGPAEAQMYRLRGKYRRRLLVRADKNIDIQKAIAAWLSAVKIPSAVRVQVDVDPQSFF